MKSVLGTKPSTEMLPPKQNTETQDSIFSPPDDDQIEASSPQKLDPQQLVEQQKKPPIANFTTVASTAKPTFKQSSIVVDTPKSFSFPSNPFSHNTPANITAKPSFKPTAVSNENIPKLSGFSSDLVGHNSPANNRGLPVGDGDDLSINTQQVPPSSAPPKFCGNIVQNDEDTQPTFRKAEEKTPSQPSKKVETKSVTSSGGSLTLLGPPPAIVGNGNQANNRALRSTDVNIQLLTLEESRSLL